MPTINSIRSKRARGDSIAQIAREIGVSEPTVRKYLKKDKQVSLFRLSFLNTHPKHLS